MKKTILTVLSSIIIAVNINAQTTKETVTTVEQIKPKYDTKKNECQLSYGYTVGTGLVTEFQAVKGLSATYYRRVGGRFSIGASINSYMESDVFYKKWSCNPQNIVTQESRYTNIKMYMLETRFNLNKSPRTKRFASYFGIGAGYLVNHSKSYSMDFNEETLRPTFYDDKSTSFENSFVAKASFQYKFNLTKNSGFVFENSFSLYSNKSEEYSSSIQSSGCYKSTLKSKENIIAPLFGAKIGYFF